jgi:hypothetical protein
MSYRRSRDVVGEEDNDSEKANRLGKRNRPWLPNRFNVTSILRSLFRSDRDRHRFHSPLVTIFPLPAELLVA